ncbi:anti-sigma regulatory factor [Pseudobacteroides cellulosolvens]|uniref:Putative anti-sigma regulatory factor, serine/threonine protein kinase n=1 Tax=Pseudobacteroides cellulosolvens ATCC 35603 = DSM 2933 TaxID=398512 RepID=A0A0L6JKI4_9FIRM|nr:anti-sigma regulatory factor [Pseudobacteroides cellulosolvens]KNY26294.1 putative anti-sigma regulatory factor, serine/threonine protein kinase [Pseudobacteroides cellulosolvens ATCC 35603 = DSM 2933]
MILYEVMINEERDIVIARQKSREAAKEMNFGLVDQTRIITAVSELSRNVYEHAGSGRVVIEVISNGSQKGLMFSFIDEGPGIEDIELVMKEGFTTGKGMGLGLPGSKRLMDYFFITSQVGIGTKVVIKKWI